MRVRIVGAQFIAPCLSKNVVDVQYILPVMFNGGRGAMNCAATGCVTGLLMPVMFNGGCGAMNCATMGCVTGLLKAKNEVHSSALFVVSKLVYENLAFERFSERLMTVFS